MSAPHNYYEYLDEDSGGGRRTARWRRRAAAGLAAGVAVGAAALFFGCQPGQPSAWPAAIPDQPVDASTTTTSAPTPTTTTPAPTTTAPAPTTTTPDAPPSDDAPEDHPDDGDGDGGGDTDGMEPDPADDDEPTEPDPCDALEDGAALIVTPDPAVLEDGLMWSELTITNCSDENVDWAAATLSTVTLADEGGNLGPGSTSALAFEIDATAYEPGAIEVTIFITEAAAEHAVDVLAFHEEVFT